MRNRRLSGRLAGDTSATAAVEMAMLAPMLIILMFGSMELGNYFLDRHAVSKQVRDASRFASRLTLADDYSCTAGPAADSGVFEAADSDNQIVNVAKTGSVDGSAPGRFGNAFWVGCDGEPVKVTMRCVDEGLYRGIYSGLDGDIPVVKVSAEVVYPSLFNAIGFNSAGLCLRAESEAAVVGL